MLIHNFLRFMTLLFGIYYEQENHKRYAKPKNEKKRH
jgi:hypothetical protein